MSYTEDFRSQAKRKRVFLDMCSETKNEYFKLFSKMTVPELVEMGRELFFKKEMALPEWPADLSAEELMSCRQFFFFYISEYLLSAEYVLTSFDLEGRENSDDCDNERTKRYRKHKPVSFFRSFFTRD